MTSDDPCHVVNRSFPRYREVYSGLNGVLFNNFFEMRARNYRQVFSTAAIATNHPGCTVVTDSDIPPTHHTASSLSSELASSDCCSHVLTVVLNNRLSE